LYHLEQLREAWERVVSCQHALGLDVRPFSPAEQFEAIYVVSGYVQRALKEVWESQPAIWSDYLSRLNGLSHELNPFDFGERSQRCLAEIRSLAEYVRTGFFQPEFEAAAPIPFKSSLAHE
jgi:hypothetical protein